MSKTYVIGRARGVDIPIQEMSVSRQHAELTFTDDGRCRIRDCDSTHGTFVFRSARWERIDEAVVDYEDLIRFGLWQTRVNQLVKSLRAEGERRAAQTEQTQLGFSRPEHRLAAILCADVVGFVRLMHGNESETLNALQSHRVELIDPMIASHHGWLVKSTGDGVLAEFGSVVDAVSCALDIQRGMADRNARHRVGEKMTFRIGISLGEVIVEGHDIFGDGVNMAARLQELAPGGGICVSAAVYEQVAGKAEIQFEDMGPRQVKNIDEPVQVYAVRAAP